MEPYIGYGGKNGEECSEDKLSRIQELAQKNTPEQNKDNNKNTVKKRWNKRNGVGTKGQKDLLSLRLVLKRDIWLYAKRMHDTVFWGKIHS